MLLWILVIIGIITLDQVSKLLALTFLQGSDSVIIINKVLRLTYVENRGAAFGMLDDKRWVFMLLSTVGILAMAVFLFKFAKGERLLSLSLAFVIGGGIGNMIDRIFLGFVVDFIDFYAFPNAWVWVFNVADTFVCVGAGLIMLYVVIDAVKEMKRRKLATSKTSEGDDENV